MLEIKLIDFNPPLLKPHQVTLEPKWKEIPTIRRVNGLLGFPPWFPLSEVLLMNCLEIVVWNCKGVGNPKFKINFLDLMKTHKPGIVALLETKVSLDFMRTFFKSLGLKGSVHVNPMGRVGGIWLL